MKEPPEPWPDWSEVEAIYYPKATGQTGREPASATADESVSWSVASQSGSGDLRSQDLCSEQADTAEAMCDASGSQTGAVGKRDESDDTTGSDCMDDTMERHIYHQWLRWQCEYYGLFYTGDEVMKSQLQHPREHDIPTPYGLLTPSDKLFVRVTRVPLPHALLADEERAYRGRVLSLHWKHEDTQPLVEDAEPSEPTVEEGLAARSYIGRMRATEHVEEPPGERAALNSWHFLTPDDCRRLSACSIDHFKQWQ